MLLIEAERPNEGGDQSRRQADHLVIVVHTHEGRSRKAVAFARLFAEFEFMDIVIGFDSNAQQRFAEAVGIHVRRIIERNRREPGLE